MELNFIIFPAPICRYNQYSFGQELIQVPLNENYINNQLSKSFENLDDIESIHSIQELCIQKFYKIKPKYKHPFSKSYKCEKAPDKLQKIKSSNGYHESEIHIERSKSQEHKIGFLKNEQKYTKQYIKQVIPCLLLECRVPSSQILLFFHGNGEDLKSGYDLYKFLSNSLNIRIMVVEYPGYGIYKGKTTSESILFDAESVYDFLTNIIGYQEKDIFVFGRSIGSGPATYLGAKRNPGALILMSPFTSIKNIATDLIGKWASYCVKEKFQNSTFIQNVICPTLFIHGQADKLIPYKHSQLLFESCKAPKKAVYPQDMDHICFDYYQDLALNIQEFLIQYQLSQFTPQTKEFKIPQNYFYFKKKNF